MISSSWSGSNEVLSRKLVYFFMTSHAHTYTRIHAGNTKATKATAEGYRVKYVAKLLPFHSPFFLSFSTMLLLLPPSS